MFRFFISKTFFQGVTIESLLEEFQKNQDFNKQQFCHQAQYWDEFETLSKSFGLYKSGKVLLIKFL